MIKDYKTCPNSYKLKEKKELKITKNNKYTILVDTETCNNDKIILQFSYLIVDLTTLTIVDSGNYLIYETLHTKDFKNGIYSCNKLNTYKQHFKSQDINIITKYDLLLKLNHLIKQYNIKVFSAYNGLFDLMAIDNTFSYKDNKHKYWQSSVKDKAIKDKVYLHYLDLDLLDLWTTASIFYKTQDYKKWYDINIQVYSECGNRKTTCEVIYNYLKQDSKIIETHIANEDLQQEFCILASCLYRLKTKSIILNKIGRTTCLLASQDLIRKRKKTSEKQDNIKQLTLF